MARKTTARRGVRLSRPDQDRFFTVMVVFSHRTLRWSMAQKTLLWTLGIVAGVWMLAMIGSAYGFWATRKIMSFSSLQQETQSQQRQLRESLAQAHALEDEVSSMRQQLMDLLKALNPQSTPALPPVPEGGTPQAPPLAPPPSTKEAAKVSRLQGELERTMAMASQLRQRMDPLIQRWSHTPSIPPTAGFVSSSFGVRISPFSRANEAGDGLLGYHSGLDITNAEGTPIQSTADGTVTSAGWGTGYGLMVVVRHTAELETVYAHLARVDVRVGQRVQRGDILGTMGRTGNATGVHLHYEVRRGGRPVNPQPYMRLQRQWLSTFK